MYNHTARRGECRRACKARERRADACAKRKTAIVGFRAGASVEAVGFDHLADDGDDVLPHPRAVEIAGG